MYSNVFFYSIIPTYFLFLAETETATATATATALLFPFRLHVESLVKRVLGVEPQERWGALLGQQPPLEFLSCSIYVPLDSDFEPAHHFQGEQLYFFLQVILVILGCSSEEPPTGGELSTAEGMVVTDDA